MTSSGQKCVLSHYVYLSDWGSKSSCVDSSLSLVPSSDQGYCRFHILQLQDGKASVTPSPCITSKGHVAYERKTFVVQSQWGLGVNLLLQHSPAFPNEYRPHQTTSVLRRIFSHTLLSEITHTSGFWKSTLASFSSLSDIVSVDLKVFSSSIHVPLRESSSVFFLWFPFSLILWVFQELFYLNK